MFQYCIALMLQVQQKPCSPLLTTRGPRSSFIFRWREGNAKWMGWKLSLSRRLKRKFMFSRGVSLIEIHVLTFLLFAQKALLWLSLIKLTDKVKTAYFNLIEKLSGNSHHWLWARMKFFWARLQKIGVYLGRTGRALQNKQVFSSRHHCKPLIKSQRGSQRDIKQISKALFSFPYFPYFH